MFELEQEASVADQIDLSTLTRVVMTHLHFDHAGGLALLPDSVPIVIQRREWEAGQDPDAIARNFFQPKDYEGVGDRIELVDGDHDLLGDGSIELLFTPGHTPGHQSVRVGEGLVIGGDVLHYASTLDDRLFPVFADDPDAQAASADRLARCVKRAPRCARGTTRRRSFPAPCLWAKRPAVALHEPRWAPKKATMRRRASWADGSWYSARASAAIPLTQRGSSAGSWSLRKPCPASG